MISTKMIQKVRLTIGQRTAIVMPMFVFSCVLLLVFMTQEEQCIAVPGLICINLAVWLFVTLWDHEQKIPFFDVGVFCTLATLVYTVYPLVNYWGNGLQFGPFSDIRLQRYHISPAELGFFHLRHVLYLFSFVIFYSTFRGKGTIETGHVRTPGRSTQQIIVLFFLLLTGYFFLLRLTTGINYNTSYESGGYVKNMSSLLSIPLLLLQISSKLISILFVFKVALLFIVVSRCRQKKWLFILILWIAAEIIYMVVQKGSRAGLVLFLMATVLLYHRMIRPLTMRFLALGGISLFIFFIFMGLHRGDSGPSQINGALTYAGIFSKSNEFQALLGTEYDVLQIKARGAVLPWYLYINDFIAILPPRQLMPFEKVSASEWYLREIGMSGTGQGLMWGVISQSIVGLDWIELALRGGVLGYLLARIHRWYVRHQSGFLATLFYMYLCLKVYYTFRDTTFSLLANFVWEVIPFYIFLGTGVAIISHITGNKSGHRITVPPQNIT